MSLQLLGDLLPGVVASRAPMRVFCQDRREDGAPCTRLAHTTGPHVGGDGDDWTDTDIEEQL